ncbi:MAG: hypothetical protein LW807_04225 [Proteobacteria bacterium]|jgi:hypothetical protein|nr:hypothetical protein [Pseudomonadota bacterium]
MLTGNNIAWQGNIIKDDPCFNKKRFGKLPCNVKFSDILYSMDKPSFIIAKAMNTIYNEYILNNNSQLELSVLELEINALNNKSYMIQWFNKFRPQDNEMNAMISLLPNNISKDLKIIHGHNDNYEYDINRHLFNLNARDKSINNNSGYSPVPIKIQH